MFKKFCAALVFVICSVAIFVPKVSATNWVWVYSDSDKSIWIDNDSISRGGSYSDYDFKAIFKRTYSEEGRRKYIKKFISAGFNLQKIYKLSYCIELDYFKNVNGVKSMAMPDLDYYTDNGEKIFEGFHYKQIQYVPITSLNSYIETMYNAAYARVRGK